MINEGVLLDGWKSLEFFFIFVMEIFKNIIVLKMKRKFRDNFINLKFIYIFNVMLIRIFSF